MPLNRTERIETRLVLPIWRYAPGSSAHKPPLWLTARAQVALDLIRPEVAGATPASLRATMGGALRRAAGAAKAGSSGRGSSRMADVVMSMARAGSSRLVAEMDTQQRAADRRFAYLVEFVCRCRPRVGRSACPLCACGSVRRAARSIVPSPTLNFNRDPLSRFTARALPACGGLVRVHTHIAPACRRMQALMKRSCARARARVRALVLR